MLMLCVNEGLVTQKSETDSMEVNDQKTLFLLRWNLCMKSC
jgi:hypothetical protein